MVKLETLWLLCGSKNSATVALLKAAKIRGVNVTNIGKKMEAGHEIDEAPIIDLMQNSSEPVPVMFGNNVMTIAGDIARLTVVSEPSEGFTEVEQVEDTPPVPEDDDFEFDFDDDEFDFGDDDSVAEKPQVIETQPDPDDIIIDVTEPEPDEDSPESNQTEEPSNESKDSVDDFFGSSPEPAPPQGEVRDGNFDGNLVDIEDTFDSGDFKL